VVILLSGYRLARPLVSGSMSWVIAVLGVWLVASPFLFGYALLPNILSGDIIGGLLLITSGVRGGRPAGCGASANPCAERSGIAAALVAEPVLRHVDPTANRKQGDQP
jgi:hypothetical protein